MRFLRRAAVGGAAAALLIGGCADRPRPAMQLPEPARRAPRLADQGPAPVDQPGPVDLATPRPERSGERVPGEIADPPPAPPAPAPTPQRPPAEAENGDAQSAAPQDNPPDRYMTIGAVLVEVGGTPIYADKIVQKLEPVFAAEAGQRDAEAFRQFAAAEIRKQVQTEIESEIYFAEALKSLSQQEQELAQMRATMYRQKLIAEAGGSLEVAKSRARANGGDLDERVRDRYREIMVLSYIQNKVLPRVEVRPQDMRAFYDRNRNHPNITQPEQLHMRLIRVDVAKAGSMDEARKKIEELRRRVLAGEDFATLAKNYSHDFTAASGGDLGWVDRGAYARENVEEAAAQLQVGQVSDIIDQGDALYLVRLEGKRPRQVKPFSDEPVQEWIRQTLRDEQISAITQRALRRLAQQAIVNPENYSIEPALELAMQRYPQWRQDRRS